MSEPKKGEEAVPLRGVSLQTRWTSVLVVLAVVPLAALGGWGLKVVRQGLWAAEQSNEFAIIDHVADTLEAELSQCVESAHRVGFVLTSAAFDPAQPEGQLEVAQEMVGNTRSLAQVAIYLPDGALFNAIRRRGVARESVPEAPARMPTVQVPEGSDGVWLPPEVTPTGVLLRYAEPVRREGNLRAWVLATVMPGALDRGLTELSRDRSAGRTDGILVLDSQRRVILSSSRTGPLAPGSNLTGRDVVAGAHADTAGANVDFAANGEFTAADGEEMVGTLRSVPRRRWFVGVRRPAGLVFATLASARKAVLVATSALAVAAALLGVWLARRTIRPVRDLMDLARAYGQRRFAARSEVRTGDELEQLGTQLTSMADELAHSEVELERRARVEAGLSRYLPAAVARSVAQGSKELALGGQRRKVTVLFADVVSFTSFAEAQPPERVVAFLNELFAVLTEVVFRHGGTVDKFMGDSVMALFGAPESLEDAVSSALAAAEDMHRFVASAAPEWKRSFGFEPQLAIGVGTGEALVGNLGSDERMEFTAIGDVVNIAARLEGLARPGRTLVTAEVAIEAPDTFSFDTLGQQTLRGRQHPVMLMEVSL